MKFVEQAEEFSVRHVWPGMLALVAANALPLLGVLFLGWNLGLILLLYWAESAVILGFNLLRLLRMGAKGVAAAGFFVMHAGLFMLVHLLFLVVLFDPFTGRSAGHLAMDLGLPLAGLAVSHGVSFFHNTVKRGEAPKEPGAIMGGFYARIVVMQLTIIFGAMLMDALGSPIWALALLVLLKTMVDLVAHLVERRKRASTLAAPSIGMPGSPVDS